jgi:hypothetical protein
LRSGRVGDVGLTVTATPAACNLMSRDAKNHLFYRGFVHARIMSEAFRVGYSRQIEHPLRSRFNVSRGFSKPVERRGRKASGLRVLSTYDSGVAG